MSRRAARQLANDVEHRFLNARVEQIVVGGQTVSRLVHVGPSGAIAPHALQSDALAAEDQHRVARIARLPIVSRARGAEQERRDAAGGFVEQQFARERRLCALATETTPVVRARASRIRIVRLRI